jgi:hypothetical protein
MILTRAFNAPESNGLGEDVTIDALLRRHADMNPNGRAVIDPPDRPVFTDGGPRRFTWAALDNEVERVSNGLKALALGRDAVVALQLPNTAENVIALLAVMRAGYVPSLLPLAWRRREIAQSLTRIGAKAAITVCRCGPAQHAEIMAFAAIDAFTLRYILAFGRGVPDGVISIDEHLDELKRPDLKPEPDRPNAGRHIALITWDATPSGYAPVARTHGEVIAAGMAHMLEAGLTGSDVIATTLLGSSIVGLATGLMSCLLSGAPLVLHHPFSSRVLAGSLATESVTHVILPGAAAAGFARAARLPTRPLRSVGAVWRPGETPGKISPGGTTSVVDVMSFGEVGLVTASRDGVLRAAGLPLGQIHSPRNNSRGPCLIQTRISSKHHVALRGALVPSGNLPGEPSLSIDNEGWADTGVPAGIKAGEIIIGTARNGVARIGGLAFPRPALEEFFRMASSTAGAAVALQRDMLFGEKPRAGNGNLKALVETLDEAGASAALMPRADTEDARQIGVA